MREAGILIETEWLVALWYMINGWIFKFFVFLL